MKKNKGGRPPCGYKTKHIRVPEPLVDEVRRIIDEWKTKRG